VLCMRGDLIVRFGIVELCSMRTWINIALILEEWYLPEGDTGDVIDTLTPSGKQFGRVQTSVWTI